MINTEFNTPCTCLTVEQVRDKGHRIAREAEVVEADAQSVRQDAEDLAALVQMAVDEANDAVQYANDVLQDILNNIANANVAELLRRAEEILLDIQSRDFTDQQSRADEELRLAIAREFYVRVMRN